jgi:hypothetical protein
VFFIVYICFEALINYVCGTFNDDPTDDSVKDILHATSDRTTVRRPGGDPLLLDLMMSKDPQTWGTYNYRGHWHIFDHIVISPGLLEDKGWRCDPDTVKVIRDKTADRKGRPDDFGSEHDKISLEERGYSDHFPVTVQLKVDGK